MSLLLITTSKGAEKRACLEFLDILTFIDSSGECIQTPFQGVLLLRSPLPAEDVYIAAIRYMVSYAKRVVPLYEDAYFLRKWIYCRGYVRPKCNERGVKDVCDRLLGLLFKLNHNVKPTFRHVDMVLHIELVGLQRGFSLLPEGCDVLDKVYLTGHMRDRCLHFLIKWKEFPREYYESNTFIIKY